MQENEFEKQVQQKMEELKLSPSAEVWQNVEAKIAEKKRRRWAILLFAVLSGVLISIFQFTNTANKNNTVSANHQNENDAQQTISEITSPSSKQNLPQDTIGNNVTTNSLGMSQPIVVSTLGNTSKKNKTIISRRKKISAIKKGKTTVKITDSGSQDDGSDSRIYDNVTTDSLNELVKVTVAVQDSITQIIDTMIIAKKNESIASIQKDTIKEKQKKKWKMGLTLSSGIAVTKSGYLGLAGSESGNYNNPGTGPIPTDPNPDPNNPTTILPGKIKLGVGFSAGVVFQKEMSKRSAISIGVTYRFMSTNITVGQKMPVNDSSGWSAISGRYAYRTGNSDKYRNVYHFIEVPVEFNIRIGAISKKPLYWDIGINASQLIYSNTLQFNNMIGVYVINNDLLNKTTIGLASALSINIASRGKMPLLIGPDIYYSIMPFGRKGLYNKAHYSFAGIRIKKMIREK